MSDGAQVAKDYHARYSIIRTIPTLSCDRSHQQMVSHFLTLSKHMQIRKRQ